MKGDVRAAIRPRRLASQRVVYSVALAKDQLTGWAFNFKYF